MAIVDLATVKSHAGLGVATTYDALLTEIIGAVGSLFDAELGYTTEIVSTTQYFDMSGHTPDLIVPYGPIVALTTLTELGATLTVAGGHVRFSGRTITRLSSGYPINWAAGAGVVYLVWTHGYTVDPSTGNLPRAIRLAAIEEVRHRWTLANAGGNRIDLAGKITGSEGGAAQYLALDLLPTTRRTLALYRSIY